MTVRDMCQEQNRTDVKRYGGGCEEVGKHRCFRDDQPTGMSEEVTYDQDLKERRNEPCGPLGVGGGDKGGPAGRGNSQCKCLEAGT